MPASKGAIKIVAPPPPGSRSGSESKLESGLRACAHHVGDEEHVKVVDDKGLVALADGVQVQPALDEAQRDEAAEGGKETPQSSEHHSAPVQAPQTLCVPQYSCQLLQFHGFQDYRSQPTDSSLLRCRALVVGVRILVVLLATRSSDVRTTFGDGCPLPALNLYHTADPHHSTA